MTTGDSVKTLIKLENTKTINDIIYWFGDKVDFIDKDG